MITYLNLLKNPLAIALTCILAVTSRGTPATAADPWTRFRGPNGTGVSPDSLPTQWTDADYKWKAQLPGTGHSSPIVFGGHVYLTTTQPDTAEQWLLSVSAADGSIVWRIRLESKPYPQHRFNSFASATPAADELHVYALVSSADHHQLVAVSHDGKEAWRRDLGPFVSKHGSGASPIVHQDMVIVPNDQDGESFIVALDCKSGAVRWKTPRKSGDAAYATPCVYTDREGKSQIILSSKASGLTGLDPATGKVLWEIGDLYKLRAVCSPAIAGDLVIATCGEGGGGKRLVAVRPGSFDGKTPAKLVYEMTEKLPYVPTPLIVGDLMFLLADGGVVTCAVAATGEVKWRERIGGDYFASPIAAAGVLYCVARNGDVVTLKATDKYEPIARMSLGQPSHATPAAAGNTLYLRTETHLIKLEK